MTQKIKAIELSGVHIGKIAKISWTTMRKNGKYHEYYTRIDKVVHALNGAIITHDGRHRFYQMWWPTAEGTASVKRDRYGTDNYLTASVPQHMPFYADVEFLDE